MLPKSVHRSCKSQNVTHLMDDQSYIFLQIFTSPKDMSQIKTYQTNNRSVSACLEHTRGSYSMVTFITVIYFKKNNQICIGFFNLIFKTDSIFLYSSAWCRLKWWYFCRTSDFKYIFNSVNCFWNQNVLEIQKCPLILLKRLMVEICSHPQLSISIIID